jgi:hypothetical protein
VSLYAVQYGRELLIQWIYFHETFYGGAARKPHLCSAGFKFPILSIQTWRQCAHRGKSTRILKCCVVVDV